jgi:hypothetical protein
MLLLAGVLVAVVPLKPPHFLLVVLVVAAQAGLELDLDCLLPQTQIIR